MIDSESRQRLGHYAETLVVGEIVRASWPPAYRHGRACGVAAASDWPAADGQDSLVARIGNHAFW